MPCYTAPAGRLALLYIRTSGFSTVVGAKRKLIEWCPARADARLTKEHPVCAVSDLEEAIEECDPISGDALKGTVTWNGESDLSAWAGQPMRLRLKMLRARLYAIQFV